jgi:hypothetical protein
MELAVGLEVDGTVATTEVAVVPSGATITERADPLADTELEAGQTVLVLGASERIVEVELALDDQGDLTVGTAVRVAVPSAGDVAGTVRAVSSVAAAATGQGSTGEDATVTVTVGLDGEVDLAQIQTPVDVYVERVLADDVVTAPVSALIALAEGGFALEVVDDGGRRLVGVETGEYADNFVEVTGQGIDAGTQVVIP